jgi:sugar fermentation stimulation protein A
MKGIKEFRPNDGTHRAFGDALRSARKAGVKIIACDCRVTPEEMVIEKNIKINLEENL